MVSSEIIGCQNKIYKFYSIVFLRRSFAWIYKWKLDNKKSVKVTIKANLNIHTSLLTELCLDPHAGIVSLNVPTVSKSWPIWNLSFAPWSRGSWCFRKTLLSPVVYEASSFLCTMPIQDMGQHNSPHLSVLCRN